jgi:hypothetical protein
MTKFLNLRIQADAQDTSSEHFFFSLLRCHTTERLLPCTAMISSEMDAASLNSTKAREGHDTDQFYQDSQEVLADNRNTTNGDTAIDVGNVTTVPAQAEPLHHNLISAALHPLGDTFAEKYETLYKVLLADGTITFLQSLSLIGTHIAMHHWILNHHKSNSDINSKHLFLLSSPTYHPFVSL